MALFAFKYLSELALFSGGTEICVDFTSNQLTHFFVDFLTAIQQNYSTNANGNSSINILQRRKINNERDAAAG